MDKNSSWSIALYEKYSGKLVFAATELLGKRDLAEDLAQDSFMLFLMYKHKEKLETDKAAYFWLLKTLRNRIYNELRRAYRKWEVPWSQAYENLIGDTGEFSDLESVLPVGLSDEERRILILHYEENLTCKEIGRLLKRSTHACETRLYRARNHCKDLLLEQEKIFCKNV